MARLFFKSFLNIFLWIILLANLALAFNMLSVVNPWGASVLGDTTNKYYGVSSLIDAFKGLDSTPFAGFLNSVKSTLDDIHRVAYQLLTSPLEITGNVFGDILNVLEFLASKVSGVIVSISAMLTFMFYFTCVILNVFFMVIGLVSSTYAKDIPSIIL